MNTLKHAHIGRHVFTAILLYVLLLLGHPISAFASTIIGVDDQQALYAIDSDTSISTQIFAGQGKGSFMIAQCSDGMIYFTDVFAGANPIHLYRFNPATPATPPFEFPGVLLEMVRGACHPTTGTLYFMRTGPGEIFEVVPGETSFTTTPRTLTLPATTPPGTGGGDIAFNASGTLYLLDGEGNFAGPNRLWTINLTTLQVENVGAVTGLPSLVHGLAFDASGNTRIALDSGDPVRVLYTVPITGGAATPITGGSPLSVYMKDLASSFALPPSPSITLVKLSTAFSDPINGTTTPKRIPGAVITYDIITTNSGQGTVDNNEMIITDPIPANTDLVVSDFGVAGSGPIAFTEGSPTSGLTYTFTSLGSTTDDVSFFTDAACTTPSGGVTPIADINGVDTSVRCVRVNPKGVFAADDATPPSPNFTIRFRARIR